MNAYLDQLTRIRLKSGVGVFEAEGAVHEVTVARTLLGLTRVDDTAPDLITIVSDTARSLFWRLLRASKNVLARAPKIARIDALTADTTAAAPSAPKRTKPTTVGIRANAVTFHSELCDDSQGAHAGSAEKEERASKAERRPAKVLEDSIVIVSGKKKVRLTARARVEELDAIAAATAIDPTKGNRFEPAPWAVWRASTHHAPIKTQQGVHLRYVLGNGTGVAFLATAKRPVAWQVLSWERESLDAAHEALVQAYHLLRVHAVRRLHFNGIEQVSLQGAERADESRERLSAVIEAPIAHVAGAAYDADLIAYGLAIGALEPSGEVLNLARELQPSPSILQLAPWGETSFLMSLFLSMYLTLHMHMGGLRAKLHVASQEADAVTWARGELAAQLKQEMEALRKEVDPLSKFLVREVSFGRALQSVSEKLPPKAWLVNLAGEDHFWEKNPNKALGERYLLLTTGAPAEGEGLAPPEINRTIHDIDDDPYLESVLPRVKLSDVNWRQQGGRGYTVFSVLAGPKEAAGKEAKAK